MRAKVFFCLFLCLLPFFTQEARSAERPKACLLLEHARKAPWTELLIKGLEEGGRDFGFDTEVIIAEKEAERPAVFRNAASECALTLTATDNFHELLRDNASNFRRSKFGCVDAGIRAPNIMCVTFADEQASFLAGMAAAMLARASAPNTACGWLSGADTPAMRSLANGFAEGVKFDSRGIKFVQAVANSFTDAAQAAEKARRILDSGAGVIALAAGAGNAGAIAALEQGGAMHVALDGWLGRGRPLGLISKKTDQAVYEIMRSAASPKFAGKEILLYDLASGGVDFELSPEFLKHPAAKEIARRVKEARAEIIRGEIRIPSLRARTLCDCLD